MFARVLNKFLLPQLGTWYINTLWKWNKRSRAGEHVIKSNYDFAMSLNTSNACGDLAALCSFPFFFLFFFWLLSILFIFRIFFSPSFIFFSISSTDVVKENRIYTIIKTNKVLKGLSRQAKKRKKKHQQFHDKTTTLWFFVPFTKFSIALKKHITGFVYSVVQCLCRRVYIPHFRLSAATLCNVF